MVSLPSSSLSFSSRMGTTLSPLSDIGCNLFYSLFIYFSIFLFTHSTYIQNQKINNFWTSPSTCPALHFLNLPANSSSTSTSSSEMLKIFSAFSRYTLTMGLLVCSLLTIQ